MRHQRPGRGRVPSGEERGAAGGTLPPGLCRILVPAARLGENAMRFINRFICHKIGNTESSWSHSPTSEQECFGTNLALTHGAGVAKRGSSMLLAEGTAALGMEGHLKAQVCQGLGKGKVHLLHVTAVGSLKDLKGTWTGVGGVWKIRVCEGNKRETKQGRSLQMVSKHLYFRGSSESNCPEVLPNTNILGR